MLTNCLAACAHLPITVCEIERDICEKSLFYHTPLDSTPPLGGFLTECRYPLWYGKTRMVWLPDGEKIPRYVYSFWRDPRTWRTDRQTDGQTLRDSKDRVYASHRAVKTQSSETWTSFQHLCSFAYGALHYCDYYYLPPITEEVYVFVRTPVCLSVCKITQRRVHGFGWNVACRQMSGRGRTD